MNRVRYFFAKAKHILSADSSKGFGVHSPFMFDFLQNLLNEKNPYYAYAEIDAIFKEKYDNKRAKFLYRLINYYHIRRVGALYISENDRKLLSICRDLEILECMAGSTGCDFDMVFLEAGELSGVERSIENNTILFISDIFDYNLLMDNFQNSEKLKILVDFFDFSIIFAKPKFQKQSYKIKF